MKKAEILGLVASVLALVLIACSTSDEGTGSLTVQLPGGSSRALTMEQAQSLTYKVTLALGGREVGSKSAEGGSVSFGDLESGEYTVSLDLYKDSDALASGEKLNRESIQKTVSVNGGGNAKVSFTLSLADYTIEEENSETEEEILKVLGFSPISSEEELREVFEKLDESDDDDATRSSTWGKFYLTNDISISGEFKFESENGISLDLNLLGHTITFSGSTYGFEFGKNVNVCFSSGTFKTQGSTGFLKMSKTQITGGEAQSASVTLSQISLSGFGSERTPAIDMDGGKLTLMLGTSVESAGTCVKFEGSTVELKGATLKTTGTYPAVEANGTLVLASATLPNRISNGAAEDSVSNPTVTLNAYSTLSAGGNSQISGITQVAVDSSNAKCTEIRQSDKISTVEKFATLYLDGVAGTYSRVLTISKTSMIENPNTVIPYKSMTWTEDGDNWKITD